MDQRPHKANYVSDLMIRNDQTWKSLKALIYIRFFYRFENRWSGLHTHSFDQVFLYKNDDFIKSFNSISIKHLTFHQTATHQHTSSACDFSAIDIFPSSYKPNEPQVRSYFILIQKIKQILWWKEKHTNHMHEKYNASMLRKKNENSCKNQMKFSCENFKTWLMKMKNVFQFFRKMSVLIHMKFNSMTSDLHLSEHIA